MTQEDKQLLLKDLCARLPYGVKFPYHIDEDSNHRECDCVAAMDTISEETVEFTYDENGKIRDWSCSIKEVKPYLRPLSSMTEEEETEFRLQCASILSDTLKENSPGLTVDNCKLVVYENDWLNANHFDYRGLIPMGLALEAPKDMYKTE